MPGNPLSFRPYEPPDGHEPEKFIFISYAHDDVQAVRDAEELHRLGFRLWHDAGLALSKEWDVELTAHIEACEVVLVFVSRTSLDRQWVWAEVLTALEQGKPVVPIFLVRETEVLNRLRFNILQPKQGINRWTFADEGAGYNELLLAYSERLKGYGAHYSPYEIDCERLELGDRAVSMMRTDPRKYTIHDVFQLTKERVVENLKGVRLLESSRGRPHNLLSFPLDIAIAYVAPLRLVTGLITRLDENWPPLVESYTELVTPDQINKLDDFHYFIEFCWLAWGPSVLTAPLGDDPEDRFAVVQAAYGDEANSLPLILHGEAWREFRQRTSAGGRYSGWPCRLENLLIVKPGRDPFFQELLDDRYALVRDMFAGESADAVALYLPAAGDGYVLRGRGDRSDGASAE
ncbi:MAG: toll/interleukin-1 receptor domain-containing protein, partial [Planctomycetes bacterium]|nr:toll/interleukin-1 receptor domain-containing protein [Planctomycetota bacterium]